VASWAIPLAHPDMDEEAFMLDLWGEAEWKSTTCMLIKSMEEIAAYIYGGQGAWNVCDS
jgi:hypothetical protein